MQVNLQYIDCNIQKVKRIHEEPGGEEHADSQQHHSEVGEHSRVHRAGVSGHGLEFLQPQKKNKTKQKQASTRF